MSEPGRSPKASAASILRAPRRPIARYRPWVVALAFGGLLLLVGLGFLIGLRPPRERGPPPTQPAEVEPGAPGADLDRRLPATYDDLLAARPAGQPGLEALDAGREIIAPTGPVEVSPEQARSVEEARAASASGPFFGGTGVAAAPPLQTPQPSLTPLSQTDGRTAHERFIARAASEQHLAAYLIAQPLSALEIKAGTIISAALVTGLNSDLPGPVIAQVTEPVFDHATGRRELIPQGARLIGRYDSQVSHGQDRALVVWTRIVFPDGRSLNIGAMGGGDLTGAAGLSDRVDAHVPMLARAVGLSTLISIGAAVAQNSLTRSADNLVLQDAAGGISASASQAGQRLVDRDLQRAPTLHVRPGWPLKIIVDKDLLFSG